MRYNVRMLRKDFKDLLKTSKLYRRTTIVSGVLLLLTLALPTWRILPIASTTPFIPTIASRTRLAKLQRLISSSIVPRPTRRDEATTRAMARSMTRVRLSTTSGRTPGAASSFAKNMTVTACMRAKATPKGMTHFRRKANGRLRIKTAANGAIKKNADTLFLSNHIKKAHRHKGRRLLEFLFSFSLKDFSLQPS